MVVARRRPVRTRPAAEPVSRRRDRARSTDEEEEEEEEEAPAPRRSPRAKREVVTRHSYDEEEDEEADEDEGDDDEEESPPSRTRRRAVGSRRPPAEDDEDDEEEEAPRQRRAAPAARRAARSNTVDDDEEDEAPPRRRGFKTPLRAPVAKRPPPGIRVGLSGAEETSKAGGGGVTRLQLSTEPELIKVLEDGPFASFMQHWAPGGNGQADRPYTCIGTDCPLCAMSDNASKTYCLNVLHLSAANYPEHKVLQIGIRAWNSLKETATDKKTDRLRLQNGFFAVVRSGKGTSAQTNFRPVKLRDIEDDWEEILTNFDLADLDDLVAEAKEELFDFSVIQTQSRRQLEEVAKYLADD